MQNKNTETGAILGSIGLALAIIIYFMARSPAVPSTSCDDQTDKINDLLNENRELIQEIASIKARHIDTPDNKKLNDLIKRLADSTIES
jgi:hypothetical protein